MTLAEVLQRGDGLSRGARCRESAPRRRAAARTRARSRADRALHPARPSADRRRTRGRPRARAAPWAARAARVRSRRLGLPAADAEDGSRARWSRVPRPSSSSNAASSCSTASSRRASSTSARVAVRSPSRSRRNARTPACMRPTSRRTRSHWPPRTPRRTACRSSFGRVICSPASRVRSTWWSPTRRTWRPTSSTALEPEVREWEPRGALVDDGQTARLVRDAEQVLAGWLVLEVHEARARAVSDELERAGVFARRHHATTWPGKSESWRRGGGRPSRPCDRRDPGGPARAVPDRHRLRARDERGPRGVRVASLPAEGPAAGSAERPARTRRRDVARLRPGALRPSPK